VPIAFLRVGCQQRALDIGRPWLDIFPKNYKQENGASGEPAIEVPPDPIEAMNVRHEATLAISFLTDRSLFIQSYDE
jgi:hypothetical protein